MNLIGTIIGFAIALIIVGSFLPTIATSFQGAGVIGNATVSNVTGTSATMSFIILPIFLIGLIVALLTGFKIVKLGGA